MRNCEGHYQEQSSLRSQDDSHGSIHEPKLAEPGAPRGGERIPGHSRCTTNFPGSAWRHGGAVSPKQDIWVQHREKSLEVTPARGSQEGFDYFALAGEIGVANRVGSLHPAPCAARELPCRSRRAPHDGGNLVKWHGESARISAGAKSPLTGGIKEANAGSEWPAALAAMRIKALIVEGQPKEKDEYWMVTLAWDAEEGKPKVEFLPAKQYVGLTTQESFDQVYERFGKVTIAGIGRSGEYRYCNAGIVFDDLEHRATRYSGRGGLGSVMGSKGLKFILIKRKGAPGVEIADKALFEEGRKKMTEALRTHDISKPKGGLNTYGTAVLVNIMNEAGGLPTRNFSSGRFEQAPNIAGEAIFEGNKERLGKELYNHACSPGCIIQCSNTWHKPDGTEHASCVEYESAWALGANCGVGDLDDVAELVRLCNEYGLDTIETGTTLAVAMETGVAEFGDGKKAIELVHEMGKGTPLGRILAPARRARRASWAWCTAQPSKARACRLMSREPSRASALPTPRPRWGPTTRPATLLPRRS